MTDSTSATDIRATGGCLCGAVRYEVHGDLRVDPPTGLRTVLQINCESAGDYYTIAPDVPRRSTT